MLICLSASLAIGPKNISLSANQIKKILNLIIKKPSIIVLSDYAKGFLTENLTQKIIKQAKKINIPYFIFQSSNV